jgi:hypothetical protein
VQQAKLKNACGGRYTLDKSGHPVELFVDPTNSQIRRPALMAQRCAPSTIRSEQAACRRRPPLMETPVTIRDYLL